MEKILLAIFSAHEYVYTRPGSTQRDWFSRPTVNRIEGIRNSWLRDVTCDYRIFKGFGQDRTPLPDEIWLPCLDDYFHSCDKLKGVIKYALDNSYDRIFKIDDDCFLWYDRLMANIPTADYVGSGRGWDIESSKRFPTIFAPGFSYWLSKKAMETFLRAPVGCWAEDRALGESLHRAGIHLTPDYRFHLCKPTKTNQYISDAELYKPNDWLSVHSLSPDQMRQYHKSLSTVITQQV
jgi:hypothetical protein